MKEQWRKACGVAALALLLAACGSSTGTGTAGNDTGGAAPGTSEPRDDDSPPLAANPCTDPDAESIDPACFLSGNAANLVREVCNAAWLPGLCNTVAFDEPGYRVEAEPTPDAPYFLAIGAMHEHSSYSDGDPQLIPRDYFAAARSGHNSADDGGDSGIRLDFMISSEHSDNEKLPVTTSAGCIPIGTDLSASGGLSPALLTNLLSCAHLGDMDHYFKWQATLRQAQEASNAGFTAMRGFEWTNDYYNHMNVYFSTNVVNSKIDGSYAAMNFMWSWLQEPVDQGGGADALAVFNHPGQNPQLSPFDGGLPHTELLALLGNSNWDDLKYVPAVRDRVVGIEVNGNDDVGWYVKALQRGWHLGPIGAEDEHQREWSTTTKSKTVMQVRGRSPQHYYHALQNRRTMSLRPELLGGSPGEKARFPEIRYYAGGSSLQDGAPLGSTVSAPGTHRLHVEIDGLPAGSQVVLIGSEQAQEAPISLGTASAAGSLRATQAVTTPATGQDWYFVLVCAAGERDCGRGEHYLAVTAPIWFGVED